MRLQKQLLLAGAMTSALLGVGLSARAQTSSTDNVLGEVVVTARRRAERVQDVPTSIIAYDQQALTAKAISNGFDFGKSVAGLMVSSNSSHDARFAIRGRGQEYGAAAGSVESYFADVPLSPPFGMPTIPLQYFDVQSAQVLKGPQGTLFGRNTTGGAVLVVPQAPTNDFGGYARVQAGDFADKQFEGAINIPIVQDKVLLRAAAFLWQRHGYGKTKGGLPDEGDPAGHILPPQDFLNQDVKEFRVSLLVKPTEQLANTTIVTYHWDKSRSTESAGYNILGPAFIPGSVALPTIAGQPTVYRDPLRGGYLVNTPLDLNKPASRDWMVVNTTTYEVTPDLTIKNIFGFIRAEGYVTTALDSDGSVLNIVDLPRYGHTMRNDQMTEELQLQGKAFDQRLTYTLGGMLDRTWEPGDPLHINFASQTGGYPQSFAAKFTQNNIDSKGVFVAGAFKLTDQLTINAGYRYTTDGVYAKLANVTTPDPLPFAPTNAVFLTGFKRFSGSTYNADLQWRWTPQNMVYGGYRHGYKRGGFNPTATTSDQQTFGAEQVDDVFLGSKNDFTVAGMKARLNAELWYDKYKNAQNAYTAFDPATFQFSSPVINTPEVKYYGVDVDFALEPTDWLSITGNYSYLHAKYGRWPDPTPGSTIDLGANPVTSSPPHQFSITPRFHTELPNNMGEIALAPTVNYQAKFWDAFATTPPLGQSNAVYFLYSFVYGLPGPFFQFNEGLFGVTSTPQRTLVDLRVEWNRVMGSKVDLAAEVTNLTNKYYEFGPPDGGTLPFGAGGSIFGPPRMFFVEAKTTF